MNTSEVLRLKEIINLIFKGGQGSGNFGHAGRPGEVGGSAINTSSRFNNIAESGGRKLADSWANGPRQNKEKALDLIEKIPNKYTNDLSLDFVHPQANPVYYGMPEQDAVTSSGFYNQSAKLISVIANENAPRVFSHEIGHHLYNTLNNDEISKFTTGIKNNPIPSTFLNVQMQHYPPSAKIEEWFAENVADYFEYGQSYDPNITDIMNKVLSGKARRK